MRRDTDQAAVFDEFGSENVLKTRVKKIMDLETRAIKVNMIIAR